MSDRGNFVFVPARSASRPTINVRGLRPLIVALGTWLIGHPLLAADVVQFREIVQPFLKQHCVKCHGEQKQESDLALHTIRYDITPEGKFGIWKTIVERLAAGEMPPDDQPRPEACEFERVVASIKAELLAAGQDVSHLDQTAVQPQHGNRVDHDALFRAGGGELAASPARLWRVSPHIYTGQWQRVIKRMRGKLGQPFSVRSAPGIKDYSALYTIDEPTIDLLLTNAKKIVEYQVATSGERYQRGKSASSLFALLQSKEPPGEDRIEAAIGDQFRAVLERLPTDEELERLVALMERNIRDAGLEVGAKSTLAAVFLLPEALYRMELGGEEDKDGRRMLSPRDLAVALSYALRDDLDQGLLKASLEGRLSTREDVRREVRRMLDSPRVQPRVLRFFEEYFDFPTAVDVFKDLPPGTSQRWRPSVLVEDTRQLIRHILRQDRNVLKELLTTNKAYVQYRIERGVPQPNGRLNEPVHHFYNLPEDWKWTKEQPIELPADQRAGILTQPSWLAAFATNNENHAILRGKWVRERLLGGMVPDLPITVDAQLPDAPHQTLRQRMQVTRQTCCWQCHRKMNPPGLAFEQFDYLGRFRTTEPVLDVAATAKNVDNKGNSLGDVMRQVPVNSAGVVQGSSDVKLDGTYNSAIAMLHKLAESPRVRQVFVRHAFRYWMGRNETLADASTLAAADYAYVESGGSMKALIIALLTSDSFLYRVREE